MTPAPEEDDTVPSRGLDRLARAAAMVLDVGAVVISVVDENGHHALGCHGLATPTPPAHAACSMCHSVAVSARPVVIQLASHRLPVASRRGWGIDFLAYAGVPLSPIGTVTGTMAAFSATRRSWQPRDLTVLRTLADAAAAVLDMWNRCERRAATLMSALAVRERAVIHDRRLSRELESTSLHDELTGLLNRRGLFAVGPVQLAILRRDERPGVLLSFDIDGLKDTNERGGQAAGDELLRSAGRILQATFPDPDTVARMGGDEFVVLAGDRSPAAHAALVTRLSAEVALCNRNRAPSFPLSWSLGLVTIEPNTTESLDDLMREADRRLYAAKHSHRPTL